jgi:hypothetical protein
LITAASSATAGDAVYVEAVVDAAAAAGDAAAAETEAAGAAAAEDEGDAGGDVDEEAVVVVEGCSLAASGVDPVRCGGLAGGHGSKPSSDVIFAGK